MLRQHSQSSEEAAYPKLKATQMEDVQDQGIRHDYQDGETINNEGHTDYPFHVVADRHVRIGPLQEVEQHGLRQFFGEFDTLMRRPALFSAIAMDDTGLVALFLKSFGHWWGTFLVSVTLVVDHLDSLRQTGSRSLIENFIGFPSGISGSEPANCGFL